MELLTPRLVDELQQQLSCPICLDTLTRPVVILPCQHNLCRACAGQLHESRPPRRSGGGFRCPTCRFQVALDRHGVYGLQRNLLVENIVDVYRRQQGGRGGDGPEPPPKDKDGEEPRCPEHEDERINIYCVSCQTPSCSLCKVFGRHTACRVAPLPHAYQSHKAELRAAVELLADASADAQAAMVQLDDTCRLVQENGELTRRRLGESCDLLFAIMEERKGQLLERVERAAQDEAAALRRTAAEHERQLTRGRQLEEQLTQTLQTCSPAQLLLSARTLQDEARRAAAATATGVDPPGPGAETLDHLSLDTREAETLLATMEFRRGGEGEE